MADNANTIPSCNHHSSVFDPAVNWLNEHFNSREVMINDAISRIGERVLKKGIRSAAYSSSRGESGETIITIAGDDSCKVLIKQIGQNSKLSAFEVVTGRSHQTYTDPEDPMYRRLNGAYLNEIKRIRGIEHRRAERVADAVLSSPETIAKDSLKWTWMKREDGGLEFRATIGTLKIAIGLFPGVSHPWPEYSPEMRQVICWAQEAWEAEERRRYEEQRLSQTTSGIFPYSSAPTSYSPNFVSLSPPINMLLPKPGTPDRFYIIFDSTRLAALGADAEVLRKVKTDKLFTDPNDPLIGSYTNLKKAIKNS